MIIRAAEQRDAAALDALLTRLISFEARFDPNLNSNYVVTDNYGSRIGADGHKVLLTEDGGEIIGFLYGFVYQIPGMFKRPAAVIDALFVDEGHRRTGCARGLFEAFSKFAAENGACRIELKVMSENTEAENLYGDLGFKEIKKYLSLDL